MRERVLEEGEGQKTNRLENKTEAIPSIPPHLSKSAFQWICYDGKAPKMRVLVLHLIYRERRGGGMRGAASKAERLS